MKEEKVRVREKKGKREEQDEGKRMKGEMLLSGSPGAYIVATKTLAMLLI